MKKKTGSKVFAGILASAMIFSMAACSGDSGDNSSGQNTTPAPSGQNATPAPAAQNTPAPAPELTKISIALPAAGDNDHTEADALYDKLVKEINEYVGIEIDWQWMDYNGYYDVLSEKIIAGNVADVIIGPAAADDATALGAAREGLFWDIAPYYKDYDNLAAIPELTWTAMSDNGHIYMIPRTRDIGRWGFGYRYDWATKLNVLPQNAPTPEELSDPSKGGVMTWQEFYDMLYAFTYNDPDGNGVNDTVGLLLDQWYDGLKVFFAWFGVPNEWGVDANGNLIHYSQTPEYKEALNALHTLYADGLINDGSIEGIPVFDEIGAGKIRGPYVSKGKSGVYVQCVDDVRKAETGGEALREQGFGTAEIPAIRMESAVDTGKGIITAPNGSGYNGTIMISTINIKTEDQVKKVLDVLNKLNDGTMTALIDYGWEGVTYDMVDGYVRRWDPKDEVTGPMLQNAGGNTRYKLGFNQILTLKTAPENAQTITTPATTDNLNKREEYLRYTWSEQYCLPNYGSGYDSETWKLKVVQDGLNDQLIDLQIKFIKEGDEAALDEALARWMSSGGAKVTEEKNEQYHAAGN